jgi:hypothetical protein
MEAQKWHESPHSRLVMSATTRDKEIPIFVIYKQGSGFVFKTWCNCIFFPKIFNLMNMALAYISEEECDLLIEAYLERSSDNESGSESVFICKSFIYGDKNSSDDDKKHSNLDRYIHILDGGFLIKNE